MKSLYILPSLLFISVVTKECYKYECVTFENSSQCASKETDEIIQLQPCTSPLVCPLELGERPDYCRDNLVLEQRYPGEYCEDGYECYSGECIDNKCKGGDVSKTCSYNYECDAGLYCNDKKVCNHTNIHIDCNSFESCGAFHVCSNYKCVGMGSIDNGKPATVSAACKSFYTYKGNCTEAPKLVRENQCTGPEPCNNTSNRTCLYESNTIKNITDHCKCGMTREGTKFCNPGIGDIDISDVSSPYEL